MKKLILVVLIIGVLVLSGCGSETGSSTQKVKTEPAAPKTEIKLSATVGQISAKISPSIDEKVKGIIKIEVTDVPEGTQLVAIAIDDKELGPGADYTFLSKTNGEWTHMVDTTEYSNGLYNIGVSAQADGDSPPSAFATGQIIIEN